MGLINLIIQNSGPQLNESIIKAGLLGLYKVLKCYAYHAEPEKYVQMLKPQQIESSRGYQQIVHQSYITFFTQQTIENTINSFITQILPL